MLWQSFKTVEDQEQNEERRLQLEPKIRSPLDSHLTRSCWHLEVEPTDSDAREGLPRPNTPVIHRQPFVLEMTDGLRERPSHAAATCVGSPERGSGARGLVTLPRPRRGKTQLPPLSETLGRCGEAREVKLRRLRLGPWGRAPVGRHPPRENVLSFLGHLSPHPPDAR